MFPTIAIVGRPNTGKSTLFNRMVGSKRAVTFDEAGTTRDRVFELVEMGRKTVLLVDTGGLEFEKSKTGLEADVKAQSLIAIKEADIVLFVLDSTTELTASDYNAAQILRESQKPVILIASKSDGQNSEDNINQFYQFGFGEPLRISAIHNTGLDFLETAISKLLRKLKLKSEKNDFGKRTILSFVGRPNVGKSSLINSLLGKDRVIVSDVPGTTRDSISLFFDYEDNGFVLVDTAGIRRSGKLRESRIEKFSVIRSLKAIEECDIAILVIDASEGLSKQDMRVSEFILRAKKGLIIVLNKAVLLKPDEKNRLLSILTSRMSYVHFAPVIYTSAKSGKNVLEILSQAINIKAERIKKADVRELNYFLERIVGEHPPSAGLKFKYIDQVDISPPTFEIKVNKPDVVHFSYRRYIENELRKQFGFGGTALNVRYVSTNVESKRTK